MRKIIITTLLAFAFSCTPKKTALVTNQASESDVAITNCPKDGNCNVEVLKNKKLIVKVDDLGGIYFETIDDNQCSVIKYTYQKMVEQGLQDGHYIEEIVFEIKNNQQNITLSNLNMQDTKMLFGRHCYCKGQAGYFKIKTGTITSQTIKDKTEFVIDFKITEVPQILTNITFLTP